MPSCPNQSFEYIHVMWNSHDIRKKKHAQVLSCGCACGHDRLTLDRSSAKEPKV